MRTWWWLTSAGVSFGRTLASCRTNPARGSTIPTTTRTTPTRSSPRRCAAPMSSDPLHELRGEDDRQDRARPMAATAMMSPNTSARTTRTTLTVVLSRTCADELARWCRRGSGPSSDRRAGCLAWLETNRAAAPPARTGDQTRPLTTSSSELGAGQHLAAVGRDRRGDGRSHGVDERRTPRSPRHRTAPARRPRGRRRAQALAASRSVRGASPSAADERVVRERGERRPRRRSVGIVLGGESLVGSERGRRSIGSCGAASVRGSVDRCDRRLRCERWRLTRRPIARTLAARRERLPRRHLIVRLASDRLAGSGRPVVVRGPT